MVRSQRILFALGLFAKQCVAQAAGWQAGQMNTTMCYWDSPRAAVIRDTLYIDGGLLWWKPGMNDGSYGAPTSDGNPLGLVYLLNFSTPFDTSPGQNLSFTAFTNISKASNGGAANNIGPQYYDGTMFANDYEWITYGGLLSPTDAFKAPGEDSVPAYQQYPQVQKQFSSGYVLGTTSTGTTRYVTNGAGVSVPSENLGFYMGGLKSPTSGPIYYQPPPRNSSVGASVLSETLIQVDMSTEGQETWTNSSLPTSVPGRANAELVWVPVSEKGVLVAIGGVIDPVFANINLTLNASDTADSKAQSPKFMSTVSVYDIAKQSWYEQATTGSPGQLTQGCAVLASAQDGTSHNIYWYGGFDGINLNGNFSDDVWILSIPSFMWMKVNSGVSTHARAGHRCIKPYPDQMFVIGGYASLPDDSPPTCLDGNLIQIFNLSSSEWITSYNPKIWSNYTVPSMISAMIGGTGTGSATQTAPSPSGFSDSSLKALFASPYNSSKIVNWYPYNPSTTPEPRTTIIPTSVPKSGGTPSYLAPVLGVVLGLFFVTLLIIAFLLWRRRRIFKQNGTGTQSEAGTLDNRRWVTNWLRATPVDAKAPTVTTDDTPSSPDPYAENFSRTDRTDGTDIPEMGGSQVHEMMDTSMPTELGAAHDTGFVPLAAAGAGAAAKGRRGVTHSPSTGSHASQASSISGISAPRPGLSPVHQARADSPPLGGSTSADAIGGVSVASSSHLRGISDTSVSTDGGAYATPSEGLDRARRDLAASAPEGNTRPNVVSPLTSPRNPAQESSDYLAASPSPPPNSSNRKSQFSEKLDEAGGEK